MLKTCQLLSWVSRPESEFLAFYSCCSLWLSSPLASCESLFGLLCVVFWWALIVVLRILHSFPRDFALLCMYHPSAFQNVGWKQYLGLLLTQTTLGREKYFSDCCFFLLRQNCTSLLAFLCRPCLCKKSNCFVINAIKITLVPDEDVVLQFSFNILKQYFFSFLCLFLLLVGGPLKWIIISSKIGCAIYHG